jgi:hypothetical protein
MELQSVRTQELLRLHADILTEPLRRGVIRSRNAPVGDLAEHLVAVELGGESRRLRRGAGMSRLASGVYRSKRA